MRILVTGAAGFIGSNLAVALSGKHSVVGLDDFSVGTFENLKDFTGDFVTADVRDLDSWRGQVGKVDAFFHQAAITDTTVTDQKLMMSVNVDAFRGLLGWAAETGAKTVVYASSAGVYGDGPVPMTETAVPRPLNVYQVSKRVMESVAREFSAGNPKIKVTGLRYFNVFGPREIHKAKAASMIWQLYCQMRAGKRPRIFEFVDQYRDFVYVKDVVSANLRAFEKKTGGVYNVCTGEKTTFNQIVGHLNAALGSHLEPDYFKNPYSAYQNETLGDPRKARRELGFEAGFSTQAGIEDYLRGPRVAVGA